MTKARKTSRFQHKQLRPEVPRRLPRFSPVDYESEEDDSEREMNADQKIVAVGPLDSCVKWRSLVC
jgi:hypothetical protein